LLSPMPNRSPGMNVQNGTITYIRNGKNRSEICTMFFCWRETSSEHCGSALDWVRFSKQRLLMQTGLRLSLADFKSGIISDSGKFEDRSTFLCSIPIKP
jgi:hypothetical protein